jgi:hypothetical protein
VLFGASFFLGVLQRRTQRDEELNAPPLPQNAPGVGRVIWFQEIMLFCALMRPEILPPARH